MAIKRQLGGIQLDEHTIMTSLDIQTLNEYTIPGMAFEQDALTARPYDHLAERVLTLAPARAQAQRQFYRQGVKKSRRKVEGKVQIEETPVWLPTAKLRNSEGSLREWVQRYFVHAWSKGPAAVPPFVLYMPEKLEGEAQSYDAGQAGEFYLYDTTSIEKMMIADGESRDHAIRLALHNDTSKGPGPLTGGEREKLLEKVVPVVIFHGIEPVDMGQIFADLNGKGVVMSKVETLSHDLRDPWKRATVEIFDKLKIELETQGRQITAASIFNNKHLMMNQAVTMVKALAVGYSGALGSKDYFEIIDDVDGAHDKLVKACLAWFGEVLDFFGDGPSIFTNPDKVLKSMPVKVVLFGELGRPFFAGDLKGQQSSRKTLKDVNWTVDMRWNGIAGDVKVDEDGVAHLSASSGKQKASKVSQALLKPETKAGALVRPGTR